MSELCGCLDIYSHGLICVRKTKFLCSENKIPLSHMKYYLHTENEISQPISMNYIQAADTDCGLSAYLHKILDNEVHNENNNELPINFSLDSAKSPWPNLIFPISFHHRKFHEYEKIELKFLAHDILFRFLSVHHNHIRKIEH